ncbi:hypothetical protein [Hoeflea prorocentri]|uniref:HPr kinase n=1 Tax=Hoeflea prorocentri TaxID=1922333 RepID=A0A9X3ZI67_9HYPH|nr:hypothetical protein [Hoeflea prorocentri]MCY6382617.1 hypothetical protein [Hoeflea prorocentri]MDA5400417.1 hypothetical protein [Hoeflea prorocentri]
MKLRHFNLAGVGLEVSCKKQDLIAPLLSLIGPWEVPHAIAGGPDYRLSVTREDHVDEPDGETVFFRGHIAGDGPFHFAGCAQSWSIFTPDELVARFDVEGGRADYVVAPACQAATLSVAESFALDHVLSVNGHAMVHAACAETPDGTGRVILHAPSGTGKTTTSLAMVGEGWKLCTDDASVLSPEADGGVVVRGVPRAIKIHRKSAGMLPWLSQMLDGQAWDENGEQWVERPTLFDQGYLADDKPAPISAVIALRRTAGPMRLVKQDGVDAFTSIMEDNISLSSAGLFPGHEQRMDVYSSALGQADCYLLEINGSPQDAAALITSELGR